jgi:elongator complex protein 1
MYKETLGKAGNKNKPTTSTFPETVETTIHARHKVNLICDAFLLALSSDKPTRLQNIITSHVCKVPPDLESGLREVAKLQGTYST